MDYSALNVIWEIFKTWYWLILPPIIFPIFKIAWLWWRSMLWEKNTEYSVLEIIFPRSPEEPMSSMEQIFSNWWSIYSNLHGAKNFSKRWIKGRRHYHITIEMVSFGPYPHVYLRVNKHHKDTIRASFYAQYPTAEINEVEDFTKKIPWNIPDRKWNMYYFDEVPIKHEVYPLKTYKQFFEPRPEQTKEEKRIDPLSTLLEGFAELKEDEILWLQFRLTPITPKDRGYMKAGKSIVETLLHRKDKLPKNKEGDNFIPPEMKLSPKEKETVNRIEDKLSQNVFDCHIRCIYAANRDIYHTKRRSLAEQYFSSFNTQDMNALKRWSKTKTKIRHFFIKMRTYYRRRRGARWFFMREHTGFPREMGNFILSTEELATMFHPPIGLEELGSFLPRVAVTKREATGDIPRGEDIEIKNSGTVESKKGEAPPNIPIESND